MATGIATLPAAEFTVIVTACGPGGMPVAFAETVRLALSPTLSVPEVGVTVTQASAALMVICQSRLALVLLASASGAVLVFSVATLICTLAGVALTTAGA